MNIPVFGASPRATQRSNILPRDVREALVKAAAIDPDTAVGESHARTCAVEDAIQRARRLYPKFFNHEGA